MGLGQIALRVGLTALRVVVGRDRRGGLSLGLFQLVGERRQGRSGDLVALADAGEVEVLVSPMVPASAVTASLVSSCEASITACSRLTASDTARAVEL